MNEHVTSEKKVAKRRRGGRRQPLRVCVKDGVLSVTIGVETLAWAAEHHDKFYLPLTNKSNLVVWDFGRFAMDIKAELESEVEDGTTMVHLMIDKAVEAVMENGGEGLDIDAMEALEEAERVEGQSS
jgi:hypothetical protein